MAIYMKYGTINGDATQSKHKDWISLNSVSWGLGRHVATQVGNAQNREASEPAVAEIVISKPLDSSSVLLLQDATTGTDGVDVTIDFCRTDKEGNTYLQMILSKVLISGYSVQSGGDTPSESINLNFTKIQYNETGPNAQNGSGQPVKYTYDLETAGTT